VPVAGLSWPLAQGLGSGPASQVVAFPFWAPVLALVLALVLAREQGLGWRALLRVACLFSPQALVSARVACLLWRAQASVLVSGPGPWQVPQARALLPRLWRGRRQQPVPVASLPQALGPGQKSSWD